MLKAIILTKWNTDKGIYIPDAVKFLRPQESLMDITGEQKVDRCTVNPVIVELWCSKETLADIELAYGAGAILKTEPYDSELDKLEAVKAPITKTAISTQLSSMVSKSCTLDSGDLLTSVISWIKTRPDEVTKEVIIEQDVISK